jgi:hypothetical protein
MAREIVRADVGLCFNDPSVKHFSSHPPNNDFADQSLR